MQDGRKARMGLRSEDRRRHLEPLPLDSEKSESSECFLPQQLYKMKDKTGSGKSDQLSKLSNPSTPPSNSRTRGGDDKMDWRHPATLSERRFQLERCTYRTGATKLIDYVEMEKKNQLVWISNEINHLSNLKKLLEDPKNPSSRTKPLNETLKTESEFSAINQWSSHGNLADREMISSRKKNSCTQTGVGAKGFSKSDGAEIISMEGVLRNCGNVNVSTQTVTGSSREASPSWSPRRNCMIHGNKKGICQCSRPNDSGEEVGDCRRKVEDKRNGNGNGNSNSDTKKEAKNRINDKCRSEVNISEYQEEFSGNFEVKGHCKGCRCAGHASGSDRERVKEKFRNVGDNDGDRRRERNKKSDCSCEGKEGTKEVRSCRNCGTAYTSVDKKCQCNLSYVKPIAYELNFKGERRSVQGRRVSSRGESTTSEEHSCKTEDCYCGSPPQLKVSERFEGD